MAEAVASVGEIDDGGRKSIIVDDLPVLLIRVGDEYHAIDDVCSHDGQPMTDGPIIGCEITCLRHGARFDITTGKALCMPAIEPIETYQVEIQDGQIFVLSRD